MSARYRSYSRTRPPAKPQFGVFVSGRRDDLSVDISARQMTPEQLGQILREAEAGNIRRQCEAFEQFETDPQIFAAISKRKRAVVSRRLAIAPGEETPRGEASAELFKLAISRIENWPEALYDLADAIGKGFANSQIVWDRDGKQIVPRLLEWWPQREFVLDKDQPDILRVLTDAEPSLGEPLEPCQWIQHRYKARSASLAQAALMRVVAWPYVFKHYAWRDWVIFSEAFGMPRRWGRYPAGADPEERRAIEEAVLMLGTDGAAVLPEGATLELLETKGSTGGLPFPDLIKLCDEQISKAILGQTLTTDAGDRGARSLGEVHERVQDDLEEADAQALARTIRRDLATPFTRWNLGADAPVPKVELIADVEEDLVQRAQVDKIIIGELGLPTDEAYLYERYGIPAPGPKAKLIQVPRGMPVSAPMSELFERAIELAAEKKRSQDWVTSRRSSTGRSGGR